MKVLFQVAFAGLAALWMAGCDYSTNAPPAEPTVVAEPAEHGHDHGAGPHDGTIGEFGGGRYHIEFVANHEKQEATVYVLGEDAKTPAPLKTDKLVLSLGDVQVDLAAQPLEGEADGMSSRFVGTHESLGKEQEFAGTVTGEVEGTPYMGEFKEEAHSHEHKP
jgi:hypothetical protein